MGQASNAEPVDEDMEAMRRTFAKFDANDSGDIDAHELRAALQDIGLVVDSEQVDFMLRKYDDDRNATLDLEEFVQLVQDLKVNTPESVQHRVQLRTHPAVIEALDMWWQTALASMERDAKTGVESSVPVGELRREQYVAIMSKVSKALLEDWDYDEATAIAEADFEHDRRGRDTLDGELFRDGLFECAAHSSLPYPTRDCVAFLRHIAYSGVYLRACDVRRLADLWTNTVTGEDYASFLHRLFEQVAPCAGTSAPLFRHASLARGCLSGCPYHSTLPGPQRMHLAM